MVASRNREQGCGDRDDERVDESTARGFADRRARDGEDIRVVLKREARFTKIIHHPVDRISSGVRIDETRRPKVGMVHTVAMTEIAAGETSPNREVSFCFTRFVLASGVLLPQAERLIELVLGLAQQRQCCCWMLLPVPVLIGSPSALRMTRNRCRTTICEQ